MKCRFLTGNYLLACRAETRIYMPSAFEIQEYCKTNRHKICPLFFKIRAEEKPLPAQSYPAAEART